MAKRLRVAVIVPPWLALPIEGYGGIELVVEGLINGLRNLDVDFEVFGNGAHTIEGVKTHSLYKEEQFPHIAKSYWESVPIVFAHLQYALNKIQEDGNFDIIHDHNPLIGVEVLSLFTRINNTPPVLHTIHGPPFSDNETLSKGMPDNRLMFEQLEFPDRLFLVGISNTLVERAPQAVQNRLLPAVFNALDLDIFPFIQNKKNYFITLARFDPVKGQHIAVRAAAKLNKKLRMAGTISVIGSNRQLLLELSNPLSAFRNTPELKYYKEKILPYVLRYPNITYSGNLSGSAKMKFIAEAKALLFPIQWEEPFGMAVIEALACGTPVVAMNRGAMPEIIEHGVTGFLANNEEEFCEYMERVDEIDPVACRRSVEKKFTAEAMAKAYLERYKKVIELTVMDKKENRYYE